MSSGFTFEYGSGRLCRVVPCQVGYCDLAGTGFQNPAWSNELVNVFNDMPNELAPGWWDALDSRAEDFGGSNAELDTSVDYDIFVNTDIIFSGPIGNYTRCSMQNFTATAPPSTGRYIIGFDERTGPNPDPPLNTFSILSPFFNAGPSERLEIIGGDQLTGNEISTRDRYEIRYQGGPFNFTVTQFCEILVNGVSQLTATFLLRQDPNIPSDPQFTPPFPACRNRWSVGAGNYEEDPASTINYNFVVSANATFSNV